LNHAHIRLPAEWEHQDGILLSWPTIDSDWVDILDEIEQVFVQLVKQISRFERVVIVTANIDHILQRLNQENIHSDNIKCYAIDMNDTWTRDCGPITLYRDGKPLLYDFGFNGWGLKFTSDKDNQMNHHLAQQHAFSAPMISQPLILEGGSIESDGQGTLLTTSECLLSRNRNPSLNTSQLEHFFSTQMGIHNFLWLEHGYLAGDDTDSHIDTLARLCPNNTIVYTACDDRTDEHFVTLKAMEQQLAEFRTIDGSPYQLLPLPWPQAQFDHDGERLPATYANFLIINGAVLVPIYDDPADKSALEVIQSAFPAHEIIGINCSAVIIQHGSLHCLTMQLPQGTLQ
jgi:agmatine deiminase